MPRVDPSTLDPGQRLRYSCHLLVHLRVGIFDLTAAVIVVTVFVLPPRQLQLRPIYNEPELAGQIESAQAQLLVDPSDGAAAARLAGLLVAGGQSDWALRVAGEAAQRTSPTTWRALLAISHTHAERFEIFPAWEYGKRALAACRQPDQDCPPHEGIRMTAYVNELEAGVQSGTDPRVDPSGFRRAIEAANPHLRFRKR